MLVHPLLMSGAKEHRRQSSYHISQRACMLWQCYHHPKSLLLLLLLLSSTAAALLRAWESKSTQLTRWEWERGKILQLSKLFILITHLHYHLHTALTANRHTHTHTHLRQLNYTTFIINELDCLSVCLCGGQSSFDFLLVMSSTSTEKESSVSSQYLKLCSFWRSTSLATCLTSSWSLGATATRTSVTFSWRIFGGFWPIFIFVQLIPAFWLVVDDKVKSSEGGQHNQTDNGNDDEQVRLDAARRPVTAKLRRQLFSVEDQFLSNLGRVWNFIWLLLFSFQNNIPK